MLLTEKLHHCRFILASQSPRRKELFAALELPFKQIVVETDESIPGQIAPQEAARYLAEQKTLAYLKQYGALPADTFLITADTVVLADEQLLGKPKNDEEAFRYLTLLSGRSHRVVTGVCIADKKKHYVFDDETKVYFKSLSEEEIWYYIHRFKPYDKAGAYGIQEWIGYIGITKIEGSYFNVMGLPVQKVANVLSDWIL